MLVTAGVAAGGSAYAAIEVEYLALMAMQNAEISGLSGLTDCRLDCTSVVHLSA
jgi:hypothetical protein